MTTLSPFDLAQFDGGTIVPTRCVLAIYVKVKDGKREVFIDSYAVFRPEAAAVVKAIADLLECEPYALASMLGFMGGPSPEAIRRKAKATGDGE